MFIRLIRSDVRSLSLQKKQSLHCEELESRCVPVTFWWVGGGADTNWGTKENWEIKTFAGLRTTPSVPPGPGADVVFENTTKGVCVVDAGIAVNSFFVAGNSTIDIKLQNPLSISKDADLSGGSISGFTPPGGALTRGTLNLH